MLCLCRSLVLYNFGAAPTPVRIAAAPGRLHQFSRPQPYAVFKRGGAPEFAMWGRPFFYAWHKDGSGREALDSVLPDVSGHLPITHSLIRLLRLACKTLEHALSRSRLQLC